MATRVTAFNTSGVLNPSSTTVPSSGTQSVNTGDMIIVFVKHESTPTTITVTDNHSNTYTTRKKIDKSSGSAANDLSGEVFTAVANGTYSDLVITGNFLASKPFRLIQTHKYRPSGSALDYDNGSTGESSSVGTGVSAAGYAVDAAGGAAVLFVGEYADGTPYTAGAGWTNQLNSGSTADRLTTGSEGTVTPSTTANVGLDWICLSISVKETAAAGPSLVLPASFSATRTILRM